MTMRQWFDTADAGTLEYAREYMVLSDQEGYVWGAIRTAFASVSDTCIVQLQDYLELGGEARMNFPGTATSSNWTWRVSDGFMTDELAKKIMSLTELYGRVNNRNGENEDEL